MLEQIILQREDSTSQGTFGQLRGEGWALHSLELPWADNLRGRSCIPFGEYVCRLRNSPKFGRVYEVTGVPGRSLILFHSGNVAGDVSKGLRSDVEGCILLGLLRGQLAGQKAVLKSKKAMAFFMEKTNGQPFILQVKNPV